MRNGRISLAMLQKHDDSSVMHQNGEGEAKVWRFEAQDTTPPLVCDYFSLKGFC